MRPRVHPVGTTSAEKSRINRRKAAEREWRELEERMASKPSLPAKTDWASAHINALRKVLQKIEDSQVRMSSELQKEVEWVLKQTE